MTKITLAHVEQLIELEASVRYDEPPPADKEPFIVKEGNFPILVSAPHGAKTFRNKVQEVWHEEDEYTAGMALLLGEICDVSVIATIFKNVKYDPNYVRNDDIPYKQSVSDLIKDYGVKFVIDLHGAALHSATLEPKQTIDLGFRGKRAHERSMDLEHIQHLEGLLKPNIERCDPTCFVVDRNKFPAHGKGTITSFVFNNFGLPTKYKVQAIQIEMKPQVRVAHRFPTATLYKSCGSFDANPDCVICMLQALVDFIEYLK